MKRLFFVNKIFLAALTAIAFGFAGTSYAQSSSNDKTNQKDMGAGKKLDGGYSMKDKPVQGGTEKSLGSSKPGSAGSGGSGSRDSKSQGGSALGGSTGDKGFSNVRENKGGKGARGTMGGGTDTKAGHAGESIGSGGTGKGDKANLDAGAPADGSSPGMAK